jgi:UDP-N-acetylglucosamine 2-epimerase (non-hydrolysing)
VAVVFGTRPEVVKLAPVMWSLGAATRAIHTGQHYSPALAADLVHALGIPAPELHLEVGGSPRGVQLGEATAALTAAFLDDRPDVVVVQGDTTTTLAGALAANATDIPLVHVEAGLRSFDRAMPEEHNRVVADHLADLCATPTETTRAQLAAESITGDRVVLTGNTVVDAVDRMLPDAAARRGVLERFGVAEAGFVLATFHRPENVDDPANLTAITRELAALPVPVLLTLHPRTAARAESFGVALDGGALRTIDPLGYTDFLALERECALVVSDSGGVQEEASVVGRPVVVVRRSTERPEVLGTFCELVPAGTAIGERARDLLDDLGAVHQRLASVPSPYGDGAAGARTAAAIDALARHGPARP